MWMRALWVFGLLLFPEWAWAVDSYRFLHVTIDTPWAIFVFLFFLVFAPMILMVILYWKHVLSERKEQEDSKVDDDA